MQIKDFAGLSKSDTLALLASLTARIEAEPGAAGPSPAVNPRRVKKTKFREDRIAYLEPHERDAFFRALREGRSLRDLALFELLFGRGLRASEAGMLRMEDLRLEAKRIRIARVKGSRSGEFPLNDRELRALRPWLRQLRTAPEFDWHRARGAAAPLFPSRNHRALSRRRLDELCRHYGAIAGIPEDKRHAHCWRHTCAVRLLELGQRLEIVQDHLGHCDIRNTQIYARVTKRMRQQVADSLGGQW